MACIALAVAGRKLSREPQIALALDKAKLHLPLGAGALFRNIEIARFTRLLALLLENGLPILSALPLVRDAAGNRSFAGASGNGRKQRSDDKAGNDKGNENVDQNKAILAAGKMTA